MKNHESRITSYALNLKVLLVLLMLTITTILVIKFHFGAFTVALALIIASIKSLIVLTYFMHLKFESLILRLMVGGIFLLFTIIVMITFIDYSFR